MFGLGMTILGLGILLIVVMGTRLDEIRKELKRMNDKNDEELGV